MRSVLLVERRRGGERERRGGFGRIQ